MKDIVERLRAEGGRTYAERLARHAERKEAADEIERLRDIVEANGLR